MWHKIVEHLKHLKTFAEQKRRLERRISLEKFLEDCTSYENDGLLRRRLSTLPSVESITVNSGGFRPVFVEVTMRDGFEITASGLFEKEALLTAAHKVARRLEEVWGLDKVIAGGI